MSLLSRAKKMLKGKEAVSEKKTTRSSISPSETSVPAAAKPSELAARIGLMPLLTEKSFETQAAGSPSMRGAGAAAFRVEISASKPEIARAVREQYGTKVLSVRTTRMRGKIRRRGTTYGATPRWKKAYVKVEDIQKLQVNP